MDNDPSERRRWRQALAASRAGHSSLAIVMLRDLLTDVPDAGPIWGVLADELLNQDRHTEAKHALQRALECPNVTPYLIHLKIGELYERRMQFRHAQLWYQRAARSAPDEASAFIYLGKMHARRGRFAIARRVLRRALQCSNGCIDEAHLNLGHLARAGGRFEEALVAYNQALEIDPEYQEAKDAIADVKHTQKYLTEKN